MTMDSFTASMLLTLATKGHSDEAADIYKSLKKDSDHNGPSEEAKTFFKENKGKYCKIRLTTYEGIVHSLNQTAAGFYPGSRCPINVEITNGDAKGNIFEYGLELIEIIEV